MYVRVREVERDGGREKEREIESEKDLVDSTPLVFADVVRGRRKRHTEEAQHRRKRKTH